MTEEAGTAAEASKQEGLENKEYPWYKEEVEEIAEPMCKVLEAYSGIPSDKVKSHVQEIRNRAFAIFPYPCLGMFRFLKSGLSASPYYQEVLERVKQGETFLDLGCCFGQELRVLAFDGSPSENLHGSDLSMEFMSLGYDLFLDKDKLKSKFIAANIFDPHSDLMKQLTNKVDIIYTSAFFHLFSWEEQSQIAKQVANLIQRRPGSIVIGRQVGNINPCSVPRRTGNGSRYRHDDASWIKMWEQVGQETGTNWKIEANLLDGHHYLDHVDLLSGEGMRILRFAMRLE
ncbi:hypothetical protein V8E54_006885 [Elaphomyces granulatus]